MAHHRNARRRSRSSAAAMRLAMPGVLVLLAFAVGALWTRADLPGAGQRGSAQSAAIEVVDAMHDPETGLTLMVSGADPSQSFEVLVDGVAHPARVSSSEPGAAARSVAIVIETGNNLLYGGLGNARSAATSVIESLGPQDRVAIVGYGSAPSVLVPLTTDHAAALAALDSLVIAGDSDYYGGVGTAANLLAEASGTKSLVAITYGWQWGANSGLGRAASLEAVEASGAAAYPLLLGPDFDRSYAQQLAAFGDGRIRFLPDLGGLTQAMGRTASSAGLVTLQVDLPMLPTGAHQVIVQANEGSALSMFDVTNTGLIEAQVRPGVEPSDAIGIALDSAIDLEGLQLSAQVDGDVLAIGPRGDLAIEPWALAPGTHELQLVALADGAVIWSDTVPLEIPALPTELTATVEEGTEEPALLVSWRVQAVEGAVAVVRIDGEVVVESPEQTFRVAAPAGAAVSIDLQDAAGRLLDSTSQVIPAVAPIDNGGMDTSEPFPVPASYLGGGIVLLGLLAAAGAVLFQRRRQHDGIDPRDPARLATPDEELADERTPMQVPAASSSPAGATVAQAAAVASADAKADQEAEAPPMEATPSKPATPSAPFVPPGPLRLVARHPNGTAVAAAVGDGPLSIGASPHCDITLTGPAVRFVHAIVSLTSEGRVRLHCFGPMDSSPEAPSSPEERLSRESERALDEAFTLGGYTIGIEPGEASAVTSDIGRHADASAA